MSRCCRSRAVAWPAAGGGDEISSSTTSTIITIICLLFLLRFACFACQNSWVDLPSRGLSLSLSLVNCAASSPPSIFHFYISHFPPLPPHTHTLDVHPPSTLPLTALTGFTPTAGLRTLAAAHYIYTVHLAQSPKPNPGIDNFCSVCTYCTVLFHPDHIDLRNALFLSLSRSRLLRIGTLRHDGGDSSSNPIQSQPASISLFSASRRRLSS